MNARLHGLYNRLAYYCVGAQERPVIFDVESTRPELSRIDENWDVIREELEGILAKRESIPRYHHVDPDQKDISHEEGGAWRTFIFYMRGAGDLLENRKACPRSAEIIESIPGALTGFFSLLDPGRSIPAHNGPSLHYLRYHTAFIVPKERPPTIRIRDHYQTWKERESFLFDDSYNHEIYNDSDELRVVLIVDFLRPKPWLLNLFQRFIVWNHLSSVTDEEWIEALSPTKPKNGADV